MLANKPADLTLALKKEMEVFTDIVDWPMDIEIIDFRQLLFPIVRKKEYDELTLMYNLSRVILPTDRYGHIYLKGAY